ncbi:MAG: AAA family ATPase, partial [Merdibacter sp.]|nr:AAA family ATPase [Merdibacter sp.]
YYVVDKSLMIQDFLSRGNEVTLITRPRRFGKTLNMSMMASFFDITKDSQELFKDTAIMKSEHASAMNQYPTIFLSFANAKGDKMTVIQEIREQLLSEYDRFAYAFAQMDESDQHRYRKIKEELLSDHAQMSYYFIASLSFLMARLEKHHGRKVMVFIDEYDTPFIEAHVNGFYDEVCSGLSSLLHNALKASTSLQHAMLTGIQRVAKENIFSDLNNLVVCTVKDREYAQYFGFTEEETKTMLEYYGLELNEEVKAMYNGYRFGDEEIYNPWSVLNYASRRALEPYWVNTSSNKMIRKAMEGRDLTFARGYEKLIETGRLETLVRMETSFFEVSSTDSLWGLFVNAGYLTIERVISAFHGRYVLRIPDQEVQQEFQDLTASYLNVSESYLSVMFDGLRYEERQQFECSYADMLLSLPSYHDLKDENSYHVLFLGMCAWLSNEYDIISNREEGKGRCDIILKAKKEGLASYVLEFKYLKEADTERLEESAKEAVLQIKEKHYDAELQGRTILIGLAHAGKEVWIEWQERS